MPGRRDVDPDLLARAIRGELRRSNTTKGSPARVAVYESERRRRRSLRPDLPARAALGHRLVEDQPTRATIYAADPPRIIVLERVSRRDLSRGAKYAGDVASLLAARDAGQYRERARAFERRWRRARPIAGYTVVWRTDEIVALAEAARAADFEVVFDSGRTRPGRRRRVTQ